MIISKKLQKNRGFTLIETIVYTFGLVLLIGTMVGLMYYMYNWYQYATISSKVDQIGLTVMDRLVRDIRTGTDIDLAQSTFNSATGQIFINGKEEGVAITKEFNLSNNRIQYEYDGGGAQYLTPQNMSISRFYFKDLSTSVSKAVKIEIQITYNTRTGPITHDFNGLAILRQSYE